MRLLLKATLYYLIITLAVFGIGGVMTYDIFQKQIERETDRYLISRLWFLTLATGLASVAGCCGRLFWWCDVLASFRVQFLVVLVIAATAFAIARKGRKFIVATLFAMTNLFFIAPLFFAHSAPPIHPPALRVMLLNLYQDNRQH